MLLSVFLVVRGERGLGGFVNIKGWCLGLFYECQGKGKGYPVFSGFFKGLI